MTNSPDWMLKPIHQPDLPEAIAVPTAGLSFGRDPKNDIATPSGGVSGYHARVTIDGDQLLIQDLGSKNGTLVGGKKVARSVLRNGGVFQLGHDGPRFAVIHTSGVEQTVQIEAGERRRPLGEETMEFVRREIGKERDAKVDSVVRAQKRNRAGIGLLAVLIAGLGGALYLVFGRGDDIVEKAVAKVSREFESQLMTARREIAAKFVRFEVEFDAAHTEYEANRKRLETRRQEIQVELASLKSTTSAAKDERERLRSELATNKERLNLYDPVNVQHRKLENVAEFVKSVVMIEVVESYRAKENGKLLYIETKADGSENPNFEKKGELLDRRSTGSGFCFSQDGWILTNAHVVLKKSSDKNYKLSSKITLVPEVLVDVVFSGEPKRHSAKVSRWSADDDHDMALVKIEPFEGMPHVPQFDVNRKAPKRGTEVFLLGFPLGKSVMHQGKTVIASTFSGIVSRSVGHFVQVDAVVHPGASGGPMIDGEGHVLGVVVGMHAAHEGDLSSAIGYTLPIADAVHVWKLNGPVEQADGK